MYTMIALGPVWKAASDDASRNTALAAAPHKVIKEGLRARGGETTGSKIVFSSSSLLFNCSERIPACFNLYDKS